MSKIYQLIKQVTVFEDEALARQVFLELFGEDWETRLEQAILNFHLSEMTGFGGILTLGGICQYVFIEDDKRKEVESAEFDGFVIEIDYDLDVANTKDGAVVFVKNWKICFSSSMTEEELFQEKQEEVREMMEELLTEEEMLDEKLKEEK